MTQTLYFEDFPVGSTHDAQGPTLTEASIIEFARQYDPQYFHIDPIRARDSIYGGLIASGWQTAALCMRMLCDAYVLQTDNLGSPGMQDLKWLKPVRPGDTVRMRMTVREARVSNSKPDRGLILQFMEVFNQRDEKVMEMTGWGYMKRRPAAAGASS